MDSFDGSVRLLCYSTSRVETVLTHVAKGGVSDAPETDRNRVLAPSPNKMVLPHKLVSLFRLRLPCDRSRHDRLGNSVGSDVDIMPDNVAALCAFQALTFSSFALDSSIYRC